MVPLPQSITVKFYLCCDIINIEDWGMSCAGKLGVQQLGGFTEVFSHDNSVSLRIQGND